MKKAVWLTFDLGISGDYDGLYKWLANNDAIECGDSVACFRYQSKTEQLEDFIEALTNELREEVKVTKNTRMYLVYRDGQKIKGRFLFGKRHQAPWTGYGESDSIVDEE